MTHITLCGGDWGLIRIVGISGFANVSQCTLEVHKAFKKRHKPCLMQAVMHFQRIVHKYCVMSNPMSHEGHKKNIMQHVGITLCICCQSLHLHATWDDFFLVQAHRKIWIIIYDDSTPCVCYRPNITSWNNMTRASAKLTEGRNTNSSIFSKGVKKTIPLQKIFGYCKGNTKKYQHKYHICKHHLLLSSWTDEKEKEKKNI